MLQQINLYDRLPQIKQGWPDVKFIIRSSIGLIVFLIFLHLLHQWQLSHVDKEVQKLTIEQTNLTNDLTDLTRRYPLASQEGGVEKIMQEIPLQINEKQKILMELSNAAKFSLYLEGLSQTGVSGVWLTEIDFDHGGLDLSLKGRAQDPELVNQFVKNIVANDIFNGKKFRVFNISQPKPEKNQSNKLYVDFYLSTLKYSEENEQAANNNPPEPGKKTETSVEPVSADVKIPPATVQEPTSNAVTGKP